MDYIRFIKNIKKMNQIIILIFLSSLLNLINAQKVKTTISSEVVCFTEGKDSILNYQIAEKSLNGTYPRANYIHPLYTLDGHILTEDFPEDHLHHRGIFWAWHQLYIGDKRIGDGWEIKDFSWDVTSVKKIKVKKHAKAIQAEVFWKSNQWLGTDGKEKPILKETTTIKVYPSKENYRQIDIEIALLALEKNMHIGGSEDEKGYGGFSQRIKLPNDVIFTSSNGNISPQNLSTQADNWMDISGSLAKEGSISGITILCHPDNPGVTNQWILRSQHSMQNAVYPFPGATAVPLSETQPTGLRYRLLIHQGDVNTLNIPKIYSQYKLE
tara:strand:- start:9002 stop:9979 length:978 start_codon:yes stop_codon:yes gene_type:complete